jgi:hypothetical protein
MSLLGVSPLRAMLFVICSTEGRLSKATYGQEQQQQTPTDCNGFHIVGHDPVQPIRLLGNSDGAEPRRCNSAQ